MLVFLGFFSVELESKRLCNPIKALMPCRNKLAMGYCSPTVNAQDKRLCCGYETLDDFITRRTFGFVVVVKINLTS